MSRPILAALCLLALPASALAQGDVVVVEQQDPQAAYNELIKAWNTAYAEWRDKAQKAFTEARQAGKPTPAIVRNPPTKEFVERAQALALEHAGEDAAVKFHSFVLKYANRETEAVKKSLLTLTMDHAESEAIGEALAASYFASAMRMGATSEVMDLLAEVIEFNASNECKAKALLARGSLRLEMRDGDEQAAGQKDLERVAELTKDEDLLARADDALFEIRHLQVGCEAPDIVGKDIDGVEFKLSDYRGKVVLLDFWGFW